LKLDAHVHTSFSGYSTIYPFHAILKESYNAPELVYQRARARGMDLVAITDHDTIDGARTLASRADLSDNLIIGEEITAAFPEDKVTVHIGVLDITETQHREIQNLRRNIRELLPYLKSEEIFTTLNHLASQTAGRLTATHIAELIPWVDGLEILNGARLPSQNRTAAALAEDYGKIGTAGSDSHTYRGLGKTYMKADHAQNKTEFMNALRSGRITVGGSEGSVFTLASDIVRVICGFYKEGFIEMTLSPLEWRRQALVWTAVLGLPLTILPVIGAVGHFIVEERYNRSLLLDLVARPAARISEAA
jgi:predicted metal-dependent phosphoesterase TrpH